MANQFEVNSLLINNQLLTVTGNSLYLNGALAGGAGGGITGISVTGQTGVTGLLAITGDNTINYSFSSGYILNIAVNTIQIATVANLASTGQQAWTAAQNNSTNLSGNLQSTGSNIFNYLKSLSGQFDLTGTNLYNYIAGLSGNLQVTGTNLWKSITGISGALVGATGFLLNDITGISITGSNSLTGLVSFTGTNINLTQSGNIVIISGLPPTINNISISGSGISINNQTGSLIFRNFNGQLISSGQNIWNGIISTGCSGLINDVTLPVVQQLYSVLSVPVPSGIWWVEGQTMIRSTANAIIRAGAAIVDTNTSKLYSYAEGSVAALGANITGVVNLTFGGFLLTTPAAGSNLVISGTSSLANSVVVSKAGASLTGFNGLVSPNVTTTGAMTYISYMRIG